MLFKPASLAIFGLIAYIAIWMIAPVKAVQSMSFDAVAYIAACYFMFVLGCYSFSMAPRRVVAQTSYVWRPTARLFWVIAVLGLLGLIFRSYDKYVVRGVAFGSEALEGRESLMSSEAGPLSLIGGVLFPFCFIPIILYFSEKKAGGRSRFKFFLALALFLYPALDALLLLSRSAMLISVCYAFLAWRYFDGRGKLVSPRAAMWGTAIVAVLMLAAGWVFSLRLSAQSLDFTFSIFNSAYAFTVQPSTWTVDAIEGDYWGASWVFMVVSNVCQYFLHGILEFSYLLLHTSADHSLGCETFAPYFKAIKILGAGLVCPESDGLYPRVGVFTSYFGPLWVDFGLLGPLFMYFFGIFSGHCAFQAKRAVIFAVPLYLYLVVIILLMPVVNFMISAQGMYVINAFLMFYLMKNMRLFNRKAALSSAPRPIAMTPVPHESP